MYICLADQAQAVKSPKDYNICAGKSDTPSCEHLSPALV